MRLADAWLEPVPENRPCRGFSATSPSDPTPAVTQFPYIYKKKANGWKALGVARRQSCQLPLADPTSQTGGDQWGSDVKQHPLRCCLAFAHPPETATHLLPSPVPYWETARGSVQSCYTARCSLTFPTRLLCAKHLAPTGAWEALGEPWQREHKAPFIRLLSLNDLPHFHSGLWVQQPPFTVSPGEYHRPRCSPPPVRRNTGHGFQWRTAALALKFPQRALMARKPLTSEPSR